MTRSSGIRKIGRVTIPVNMTMPVDLMTRIKKLREKLEKRGLDFNVSSVCAEHLESVVSELEKKEDARGKR